MAGNFVSQGFHASQGGPGPALSVVASALDSSSEVHLGDAGVSFAVTVTDGGAAVDLSGTSLLRFVFQKPDGTTLEVDAEAAAGGVMSYSTGAADLDQAGTWRYQPSYGFGTEVKHLPVRKFKVLPNLPL